MSIRYTDYLSTACNEQIMAFKAITDPRSITSPENVTFSYVVNGFSEQRLYEQARIFRELFTSKTKYVEALNRYIQVPVNERDNVIENSYIYSFIKTVCLMRNFRDSGFNYYGNIPTRSHCFIGHKVLLYTYMIYNQFTPARSQMSNLSITKILQLSERMFEIIEGMNVYNDSLQRAYPGGIFNPTYERVLEAMIPISDIHVSDMSHTNDIDLDGAFNPLGNMAFSKKGIPIFQTMENSIATVRSKESITDTDSKFWNTANFICIDSIDEMFNTANSGSPYHYVANSLESDSTRFAEVKAITGISIDFLYSDFGESIPNFGRNLGKPYNPVGPIGPLGPNGPANHSPGPSFSNGQSTPQYPKKPPNGSGFKKLKKGVKSYADNLGRTLTSNEAKAFISSTAQQYFGHRLKQRQIDGYLDSLKSSKFVVDSNTKTIKMGPASIDSKTENLYFEDIE